MVSCFSLAGSWAPCGVLADDVLLLPLPPPGGWPALASAMLLRSPTLRARAL